MKTKIILFTALLGGLLMFTACSENPITYVGSDDDRLGFAPFTYSYLREGGYSEEYLDDFFESHGWEENSPTSIYFRMMHPRCSYFIKGLVIDKIDYGLKIQILDDLKGNMTDTDLPVIVWGNSRSGVWSGKDARLDDLTRYTKNDTLLMLVKKQYYDETYLPDNEKNFDYRTFSACWCVLQFENGFVTGYIHTLNGEIDTLPLCLDKLNDEMETMLWSDLQEELIDMLTSKK